VDPGSTAGTSTALVRVVQLQPMKIDAEVSELQVARLRTGMPAQVTVDGLPGRTFVAHLARLGPATNAASRIYTAELEVDNGQELIKPGMFCRSSIVLRTVPDAVIVSRDTLVENGETKEVYAVVNGKIEIHEVEIGAANENQVQVLSGVTPGDVLVRSGQTLLAKGQSVKATQQGAQAAAAAAQPATPAASAVPAAAS
jgi:membrane fusion protein (multidrug efflux system)